MQQIKLKGEKKKTENKNKLMFLQFSLQQQQQKKTSLRVVTFVDGNLKFYNFTVAPLRRNYF